MFVLGACRAEFDDLEAVVPNFLDTNAHFSQKSCLSFAWQPVVSPVLVWRWRYHALKPPFHGEQVSQPQPA